MDRKKIRSVLMTPSTHTQQTCHTLAQSYKKKWVANEDFYCVQIIIYWTIVHYYKIFGRMDQTVGSLILVPS